MKLRDRRLRCSGRTSARAFAPGLHARTGRRLTLAVGLALGWAMPLLAGIQWQETRLVLDPPAGVAAAVAEFEFVNRGSTTVRITDVQAGCGCTVLAVEPTDVAPGGKGRVKATYNTLERSGLQKVAISVRTQEPEDRQYELALEVRLKDFATLTPSRLFWRVGADAAAKEVEVQLLNGFRFTDARSSGPEFFAEIVDRAPNRIRLKVTPRDLWAQRSGSIHVTVAQPGQPPVHVDLPIRVL